MASLDSVEISASEVLDRVYATLLGKTLGGASPTLQLVPGFDSDQIVALEFYPWRTTVGSRAPVRVADLLKAPDAEFIERCYRLLLVRDPTEQERSRAKVSVNAWGRLLFVLKLRSSREGRAADISLQVSRAQPVLVASRSSVDSTFLDLEPPRISFRRPLLSIGITTYNRADWLAHSLALILEQTLPYADFVEVFVCDNASTDHTPRVVESFRRYPQLLYHRNQVNVGLLGNLGATCDRARGRYVWVIGDDDLMVEGAIERVLTTLALYPSVELIYTNYAFTRFERPEELADAAQVIRSSRAISSEVRDRFSERMSSIAAKSENCFTGIYCMIFREDHARGAYLQNTSGAPFSSLKTCVPAADYVCRTLLDRPGYWLGDPCVVVNTNVSWLGRASLYILERFPELFELMQANGVDASQIERLRARHVRNLSPWFRELYLGSQRDQLKGFSVARLVRRFAHLEVFREHWPELRRIYDRAFAAGSVEDPSLTPERLDALLHEVIERSEASPSAKAR